jgi:hypothetical protein
MRKKQIFSEILSKVDLVFMETKKIEDKRRIKSTHICGEE